MQYHNLSRVALQGNPQNLSRIYHRIVYSSLKNCFVVEQPSACIQCCKIQMLRFEISHFIHKISRQLFGAAKICGITLTLSCQSFGQLHRTQNLNCLHRTNSVNLKKLIARQMKQSHQTLKRRMCTQHFQSEGKTRLILCSGL